MTHIRKLKGTKEFTDFVHIVADAYPGFKIDTEELKQKRVEAFSKIQEEDAGISYYGVFREEQLVGGMRYHDFTMNLLSKKTKAGGIGLVAVHPLHKKEKIAKSIVAAFMDHYRKAGASMALLYPFRPDFYKKMGFGFGTSMNQYRIKPMNLPKGGSKEHIRFLKREDAPELLNCYHRMYEKTNGLIEKNEKDFAAIFDNPRNKMVGYVEDNEVKGYLLYEFKNNAGNVLSNDMVVNQMVFEHREALMAFMTYLNSQSDQIRYVVFHLQDEDFRFILEDPTNDSNHLFTPVYHECSIQGTGIMYRVLNIRRLFEELKDHNFNHETCQLKIRIQDNLIEENNGSIIVGFKDGLGQLKETDDYDVEIHMDIADFSSLITCAVSFQSLYKYGRASISNEEYVHKVNRIFSSGEKPICMTMF